MKKVILFFVLILFVFQYGFSEIPENLLEKSDEAYIPSVGSFHLVIENYDKDVRKQAYEMNCFLKGNGKYLIFFTAPAIMKGQGELRLGDVIYSYVRKTDKISQVSAKIAFYQSVLAQEDVMSSMLSNFYTISNIEEINDNGKKCYRMKLVAKEKKSTYATIVADIDAETLLPIKRDYYSYSNQLVKEMVFNEIIHDEGKIKYVSFDVKDMLRTNIHSKVIIDNFNTDSELNDSDFSISYLKANVK